MGELSKSNNFSYDLLSSVDNRYGVETFSGTWNGGNLILNLLMTDVLMFRPCWNVAKE